MKLEWIRDPERRGAGKTAPGKAGICERAGGLSADFFGGKMEEKELLQAIGSMMDQRLEPIRRNIAGMQADISGVKGNIAGMQADISGVKGNISGMQADISGMKGNISGMQADIAGMQTDIAGMQADISGMQADISGVKGNISGIQADIPGLREGQTSLRQGQESLRQDTADLRQNQKLLQEDVTKIKVTLENEIGRKLSALFDGHQLDTEKIAQIGDTVDDIDAAMTAVEIVTKANTKEINKLKAKTG